jgi:hypothetical protein
VLGDESHQNEACITNQEFLLVVSRKDAGPAVEPVAVNLHHQPFTAPHEVELEAAKLHVRLRRGQAGVADQLA